MNERIDQLWGQALDRAVPETYSQLSHSQVLKIKQVFAELIVQECAAICINKNVSNLDLDIIREAGKFTLQDLATKSCGENLSKQIKEHFGVEE